jgi:hypothetical protein
MNDLLENLVAILGIAIWVFFTMGTIYIIKEREV